MRQLQLLRSTLDNASIFELNSKGKDSKIEKDNKQVYDKLDHSLYIWILHEVLKFWGTKRTGTVLSCTPYVERYKKMKRYKQNCKSNKGMTWNL